ncbi:SIMPL domain-containing protein [Pseudotenacibaculum haliotis]|uniref:SIMPL domain-containing protein n=1 Tax=Pseudotenacibaculum haliotis TaxID=1862138 RepID=A0ABW5LW40_9FLAO
MKRIYLIAFLLCSVVSYAQNTNNKIVSHVETMASVDTLVVPDRIYMNIRLDEKDTKGRVSIEKLEKQMESALKAAGVNLKKQLSLGNLGSDFSKYFLRKKEVTKEKIYQLLVYDAKTLSKVLINLEKVKVSNVWLRKVEYSKADELKLFMRQKAVLQAKLQAENLAKPLEQQIGKAFSIYDINTNYDRAENFSFDALNLRSSNYKAKPTLADSVEFRKIKITSSVRVKFYLY